MVNEVEELFPDIESLALALKRANYLADPGLSLALFCAVRLGQPILLEGEPGVGKTEAAKALSVVMDTPLVRLQCYEGISIADAAYEWNYGRQLLSIRLAEQKGSNISEDDLFSEDYLIQRPLLKAIRHPGPRPAVLLIDEIDRSDDEFEAFLLELLGESAMTIPELGTFVSNIAPIVVLTSNRTRDLHDALKRRCMYHWISFPDEGAAAEILRLKVPSASISLITQVVNAVSKIRSMSMLQKLPGIAEAINWVSALDLLGIDALDENSSRTLGFLLKYREDQELVEGKWHQVF